MRKIVRLGGMVVLALMCVSCMGVHQPKNVSQITTPATQVKQAKNGEMAIRAIAISDHPKISPNIDIKALLQSAMERDQPWRVSEIEMLTAYLTERLRNMGYPVGTVAVTQENVALARRTGELRLSVFDGNLGRLRLDNQSPVGDKRIEKMSAHALCGQSDINVCHDTITNRTLERQIMLVGDLPNVSVEKPVLTPGEQLNTTDIKLVTRARGSPVVGTLTYDNYGNDGTGKQRFGVGVDITNTLGWADDISLSYTRTDKKLSSYNAGIDVALGYSGLRGGIGASRSIYTVGSSTGTLIDGTYDYGSVQLNYPLVRALNVTNRVRLTLSAGRGKNNYLDDLLTTTSNTQMATLTFSGDPSVMTYMNAPLTSSYWQWSVSASTGNLHLDDDSRQNDAVSAMTDGSFSKGEIAILRKQNIDRQGYFSAIVNVRGQSALSHNLDSGQKMAVGGPMAVRAYPMGEWGSDDAIIGSLDLKATMPWAGQGLSLSLFGDVGRGGIYHSVFDESAQNTTTLHGVGIGLDLFGQVWRLPYQAGVAYARRNNGSPKSTIDPAANAQTWVYVRLNMM